MNLSNQERQGAEGLIQQGQDLSYQKQSTQEYAQKVLDFMERLYPKLIEIMKEHP